MSAAASSLDPMRNSLLFLVFAVPLAVSLDDVGVFVAIASRFEHGRHLVAQLWWLSAAVVMVFNLDAAVVLLTPLYIRIARRHGLPAEALAFQPALLACLASGALPVSNLTNLIIADQWELGVRDFLTRLAPATVAATAVGYLAYRLVFRFEPADEDAVTRSVDQVDPRALRRGLPVIAFVVAGFTVGDAVGIPAWVVAALACGWMAVSTRRARWRVVPISAITTAASLAVLVAAAVPHLPLDRIFERSGRTSELGVIAFGSLGSALSNNLPVVLAGATAMERADQAWPLLVGANIASVFVVTASLSGLLWRETADTRRRGGLGASLLGRSGCGSGSRPSSWRP